jgi:hypothetical protein
MDIRSPLLQCIITARELYVDVDCCLTVCVVLDSHGLCFFREATPVFAVLFLARAQPCLSTVFGVTCDIFRRYRTEVKLSFFLTRCHFLCFSLCSN